MDKKMIGQATTNFFKGAGAELVKKVFRSDDTIRSTGMYFGNMKVAVDIVTKKYDWIATKENAVEIANIVVKFGKSAAVAFAEFEITPILTATLAFSIVGPAGSALVYTTSKGLAVIHGLYGISKTAIEELGENKK